MKKIKRTQPYPKWEGQTQNEIANMSVMRAVRKTYQNPPHLRGGEKVFCEEPVVLVGDIELIGGSVGYLEGQDLYIFRITSLNTVDYLWSRKTVAATKKGMVNPYIEPKFFLRGVYINCEIVIKDLKDLRLGGYAKFTEKDVFEFIPKSKDIVPLQKDYKFNIKLF